MYRAGEKREKVIYYDFYCRYFRIMIPLGVQLYRTMEKNKCILR